MYEMLWQKNTDNTFIDPPAFVFFSALRVCLLSALLPALCKTEAEFY